MAEIETGSAERGGALVETDSLLTLHRQQHETYNQIVAIASTLIYGPSGCGKLLMACATLNGFVGEHNPMGITEISVPELVCDAKKTDRVFETLDRFRVRAILIEDIDDLLVGHVVIPVFTGNG